MTTLSRNWQYAAAAVTVGVALPIAFGDFLLAFHVITALGRVAGALP